MPARVGGDRDATGRYTSLVTISLEAVRPKAVLVAVQLQGTSDIDHEASLAELERLVDTLGFDVVGRVSQRRSKLAPAAGLGAGKLKELAMYTGGTGEIPSGAAKRDQRKDLHKPGFAAVDQEDEDEDEDDDDDFGEEKPPEYPKASVVVIDNELSPSQVRNLENAAGCETLDRAGVIIEIFWRHARTKEAQMQVEIARLQYELPRMREKEYTADRQRGQGGGGKGDEEMEIDKRRLRDRIAELKEKLETLDDGATTRRLRRKEAMRVALVGYTNAGKSSLMRALSGSEVLVADKLFATLGTTVRVVPDTQPKILVSDTVGFIKQLPHALVASFKSTLDEAHEASLLLFVVDASDAAFPNQLAVTKTVLKEIDADDIPTLLILNKIDRVDEENRARLKREYPHAIQLSALDPKDVKKFKQTLEDHFATTLEEAVLAVPHAKVGIVMGQLHESVKLLNEQWDGWGARLQVRGPAEIMGRLRGLIGPVDPPPFEAEEV